MNSRIFFVKRYLVVALVALGMTLLVFLGGNYGLYLHKQQLKTSIDTHKQQLESATRQVQFLRDQVQLSQVYGKKYTALTSFGAIYNHGRVLWTDELLKIQKKLALKPFVIQFEPRQILMQKQLASVPVGKDIFYFTRLNLTVGMHSDLDLFKIFDDITKNITPLYFIESCHLIARPSYVKSPKFREDAAGIRAECSLILLEAEPNAFKKDL